MRHRFIVALLILGAVWAVSDAQAEVRAILDRDGQYVETRFLFGSLQVFSAVGPNIWTPVGPSRKMATLNPHGDAIGDLWPAIGEWGQAPNYAWAVWSRRLNMDYELVWSHWSWGGWRVPGWIYPEDPRVGDDLDPDLDFDDGGRPYLVWWREENGQGRVFMSLFLVTQWMAAYSVSSPDIDARNPAIQVNPEGEILVTFDTPDGVAEQTVYFTEPVTITDDIDPLDCVLNGGLRYLGESNP